MFKFRFYLFIEYIILQNIIFYICKTILVNSLKINAVVTLTNTDNKSIPGT